jgi:peptide deformylase
LKPILQYPDPILTQVSKDVTEFGSELNILFEEMKETLINAKGVGLSAVQIGVLLKACVIKDGRDGFLEMCNPVIVEQFGDDYSREGCLSATGLFVPKHAPEDVTVEFLTPEKEFKKYSLDGVLARCLSHELSHMTGHLIVDAIPQYKRQDVLKKWKRGMK